MDTDGCDDLVYANAATGQNAEIVRRKLLEAKERWETVASPAQLNQLIGELVGPSIVTADGRLLAVPKEKPVHESVHGVIAGGRYVPSQAIAEAFWIVSLTT